MEDHLDRKVCKDDGEQEGAAAVELKPTRSFRYEDYSTRRVFLRSYPLQWDWSPEPDEKHKQGMGGGAKAATGNTGDAADDGERCGGRGWTRQPVVVAMVEWGEDKLLLLRRAKKRLALYLLGCSHGHRPAPALPFRSGSGSCGAAMLASR